MQNSDPLISAAPLSLLQATEQALADASQGVLSILDLFNAGQRLADAKHPDIAILLYRTWLERTVSPIAYMAQFNLGVILSNINDDVGAEAAYRAAIAQKPTFIEGILNLGTLLERLRRPEEALSVWRTILTFIDPSVPADSAFYVQTLNNLGRLLEIQKQLPEAEALLARSLKHDRKQPDVITHWVHLRQKLCEWPVYSNALGIPMKDMISGTSSLAMLSASDDPAAQLKTARRYVDKKVLKDVSYLSSKQSYGHERLRIGYLSSDFCSHAVSILTAELYGLHDRSKFEVYGFCWSNDDASPLRARVISGMDHHIKIGGLSDEDAAHLIHSHEIDILVDLHGLTLGTRHNILSYRPAPVQMTWLGFPGPTAIPEIDYVLCDAFVFPPELEPFFTEKPLRLPNVFQVNDRQRLIGVCPTKESCGLPENVFVFCCFNNTYKITPEVFGAWMRILKRVPNSLLWLVADNETVQKNLFKQAKKHGIAHNRLRFAERALPAAYLARFQVADLFLDTFPFGGGTTASDALWAGLPFLTYTGRTFASRMAGSLLNAVDLPELITYNLKDYENKAVDLAKHPERIAAMKQQLVDNRMNCALFDTPRFVRDLEAVLLETAVKRASETQSIVDAEKSKPHILLKSKDILPAPVKAVVRVVHENVAGSRMKIATLIPAYKVKYIPELLDCLAAQTVRSDIVIISDDSPGGIFREALLSPTHSSVISDLNLVIHDGPRKGPNANFHNLMKLEGGFYDLVHVLFDDDVIYPNFYRQHLIAHSSGSFSCSISARWTAREDGQPYEDLPIPDIVRNHPNKMLSLDAYLAFLTTVAASKNWLGEHSNVVWRSDCYLMQHDNFLEGVSYAGLWDLGAFLRVSTVRPLCYIQEHLGYFRRGATDQNSAKLEFIKSAFIAYAALGVAAKRAGILSHSEVQTCFSNVASWLPVFREGEPEIDKLIEVMPSMISGNDNADEFFLEIWNKFLNRHSDAFIGNV
jgi:predicted O-linked N-acetylglucosamine transferase (SPINDLY family)